MIWHTRAPARTNPYKQTLTRVHLEIPRSRVQDAKVAWYLCACARRLWHAKGTEMLEDSQKVRTQSVTLCIMRFYHSHMLMI